MEILTSHGDKKGRKDVLEIMEAGLQAIDPYARTKDVVKIEGNMLYVGGREFECIKDPQTGLAEYDLDKIEKIWVIGVGKGAEPVARSLEDILGDRLAGGEIILKHGDTSNLKKINVTFGGHPIPDEGCVEGCRKILELSKKVSEKDVVFTISANGISSLLTMPVPNVTIEDVKMVTRVIQIEKGVSTRELNKVRNHLDIMKGGRVSRYFKQAPMVHLLVIDVNTNAAGSEEDFYGYEDLMRENIWLHFLSEGSTFQDAVNILKKYDAWDIMPESVRSYLISAPEEDETVKYDEYHTFNFRLFGILPESMSFLPASKKKAIEKGYNPAILTKILQAEASSAGLYSASIARWIEKMDEPFKTPCCLFTGGELLVTCGKESGVGGRNQEYVLSAAKRLSGSKKCVIAAVDTDGTDGPGGFVENGAPDCFSGGVVDGETIQEANKHGVDIDNSLESHSSSSVLWKLKSAIIIDHNISIGDFGIILIHN